jgi:glycosyltransferase involved in cell wall biosynthesis
VIETPTRRDRDEAVTVAPPNELAAARVVFVVLERSLFHPWWPEAVPIFLQSGVRLIVATVERRGPLNEALERLGIETFALGCGSAFDYPPAAVRVGRLVRSRNVDVVHAVEPIPALIACWGALLARRGVRIFHRQHLVLPRTLSLFSRLAASIADVVVACSRAAAEHAHRIDRVPEERIRVIYNSAPTPRSVSHEEAQALRDRLGIAANAKVVSVVSRLRAEKGIDTLLRAYPQVARRLSMPVHLVIAGTGPEESALKRLAADVGGNVHFVGHQNEVAPWYAVGDVVAVPSYVDAAPIAVAEAMAARRPVVASRTGGVPEFVEDGVTGLLVPPRESTALADALVAVLEAPSQARRLAEAGRARYEHMFKADEMARSLSDLWTSASIPGAS